MQKCSIKIGNMKKLYVVATWIFWWRTAMSMAAAAAACNNNIKQLASGREVLHLSYDYPLVTFTTQGATRDSYNAFVEDVRRRLSSGRNCHGVALMRDPDTVSPSQRFLLVAITNYAGESVTLAIDVTNAYVVAYRAPNDESFFFNDAPYPVSQNLFTDTRGTALAYSGNYIDLQNVANTDRSQLELGMSRLDVAITNLYHWRSRNERDRARAFLVCIQMISEAARFSYIQRFVARWGISGMMRPDSTVLSFENNWGRLSSAIQNSGEDGVFPGNPVQLRRPDGSTFEVDRVTPALVANLGLLKFECNRSPQSVLPGIRRSVVDGGEENKICETWEPTVRISGRNGLCADVKGAFYNNGDPIILWPCKSNTDANQLWTLKKDGTIRSNGKCLTTFANEPGKYMMIYDCPVPVTNRTIWKLSDDGSIINPPSGLALTTASSGESGTELNVNTNNYAAKQGWVAGNITQPFVTTIAGFKDLCLQAEGDNTAWLGECNKNKNEQLWAIYADGSIRPHQNRDKCLACKDDDEVNIILIESCTGSSKARWLFKNDNTISNLHNKLVMDVRGSDLSFKQIIIYRPTGNPNQKWFMAL